MQNRVDPFGAIHAVPERGLFTGNRGIIHDPDTKTLLRKRWALRAWIICACDFKSRRREPMGRNRLVEGEPKPGWTELFFLDEVTALAAGHRPCFFCRRERAIDYASRFGAAFDIAEPRAPMADARLHRERLASGGRPVPLACKELGLLPDGAMIAADGQAFAIRQGRGLPWSFGGYGAPVALDRISDATLLTPATSLAVLRQGYRPVWHASAED
ncbi:hypothetical protein [Mesorhizobium sp. BE184]|uniref:hypothetical protein n=1 Tax=Mesorhizobium sp. BE184 TaxID=2817714 RepID=UPI00286082F9|nr:hypothetical protein [Mesorhizobium sp. BE184]MDR7033044.1 hypothetical protein [Mesorhizobium sp. BE184]